jgi:hypothetical protein
MAFTNTVATLPGITVPIFVGKLTHSDVSFMKNLKKVLFEFSSLTANNWIMANHFRRYNCPLHHRDCCLHELGVR